MILDYGRMLRLSDSGGKSIVSFFDINVNLRVSLGVSGMCIYSTHFLRNDQ